MQKKKQKQNCNFIQIQMRLINYLHSAARSMNRFGRERVYVFIARCTDFVLNSNAILIDTTTLLKTTRIFLDILSMFRRIALTSKVQNCLTV